MASNYKYRINLLVHACTPPLYRRYFLRCGSQAANGRECSEYRNTWAIILVQLHQFRISASNETGNSCIFLWVIVVHDLYRLIDRRVECFTSTTMINRALALVRSPGSTFNYGVKKYMSRSLEFTSGWTRSCSRLLCLHGPSGEDSMRSR
jgi:hypothetical protein